MRNKLLHTILFPFSLLYGGVTIVRNWLFNKEIIKTTSFDIPIISVGNLSVGGTGKTPHTEFILSFLQKEWKTAMLSRGYKRKTKGFYLANDKSKSTQLGDEPYQIHRKFPKVAVAVDEKRVEGVTKLMQRVSGLQAVVLDDAFQHRYIRPGISILLTDYSHPFTRDRLLPSGRLRECKKSYKRADIIIVTKCPKGARPIDLRLIATEIKPSLTQFVFFSTYEYDDLIPVFPETGAMPITSAQLKRMEAGLLIVAGIVNPKPMVEHLTQFCSNISTLFFGDHYQFKNKDFNVISKRMQSISLPNKLLVVTEKDAARLVSNPQFPEELKSLTYALPIRVKILQEQEEIFIQKIRKYVAENSRNR